MHQTHVHDDIRYVAFFLSFGCLIVHHVDDDVEVDSIVCFIWSFITMIHFRSSSEWYDTTHSITRELNMQICNISYIITQHHHSPHHWHQIIIINIILIHHMHHAWQLIHPIPHNVLDSSLSEVEDRHHIIKGLPLCSINDFEIEIHVVSSSMIHHDTWYMYHEWWIVSIVCDIEWSMYRLIDRLNDRMIDWLFSLFNRSICFDKSHHSFIKLIHSSNDSFTWFQ